ncbi:uncharacterized protein LOC135688287 isoform X1 [Rhopilema esculentum]|uniref:uncharacterized protein LOC135688287 isoform X1 n=2 Tax=Rhopilema esculentum TaxID=499914 RepID=UPI0031DBE3B5
MACEPFMMSMEDEEVVYSGRVKFKVGLISRWSTVFCTLCEGLLRVHESPDSSADPIHCFMSSSSWISAQRAQANTFFVLNETDPNSVGSKIFLFDTESADLLHLWLHGFKKAGWSSAIKGEKLNYRTRNNSGPNKAYRESGFGGSLRGTRSQSEPTFFVTGRPKMGGDDIDLDNSYRWIGPRRRRANLTSVFSDIDISTESYAEEASSQTRMDLNMRSYETEINDRIHTGERAEGSSTTYLQGGRNVDKSNERGAGGNGRGENGETANESGHFGSLSKEEDSVNTYDMHVNFVNRNNSENIENTTGNKRPEVSKHHSEPNISKSYLRPSRQGRFDYSRIFFDPTLSPDMKGKLMEAESRTRKTSVTRKGEHIRLSESDEHDIAEQAASSSYINTEKNESATTLEVTNVDTGEKERLNDNLRQRKCSSVASDGIADLNVDVDGDSSVFHPGIQGSPMSYLESGYCSKESLSTNESLDQRKSSVSNIDEINNNNDEKTELENEAEVAIEPMESQQIYNQQHVHNTIKPATSESKNGRVLDGTAGGTDVVAPFSETVTMTPRPGRSPNMKLEKRASMSQLLNQLKDRLPGRKNKGQKRGIKKDLTGTDNLEPLLWNNNGKWKERWYALYEGCLLFYKDSAYRSPDFALDVRACKLEIPTENQEQGFLSFKLLEIDGKSHELAMLTEDSYKVIISSLQKIKDSGRLADSDQGLSPGNDDSNGLERDGMTFDDAIIPYSESEHYPQIHTGEIKTQREKHESTDSGTDGDISCFEGSDASNVGIDQYATDRKDKMARRRKTSSALPQPVVITEPNVHVQDSEENSKGRVASIRNTHRPVVHCESSPPSPRSPVRHRFETVDKATKETLRPIEYLNVEDQRRLPRNRYSMPVFTQKSVLTYEEFNRQRRSCLEELLKLKEAHDKNQYPDKGGKFDYQRASSVYAYGRKSAVLDENDNHADVSSFEKMCSSYPKRSRSFKLEASPCPGTKLTGNMKHRHRSMINSRGLSKSMILPTDVTDAQDVTDDLQGDLQQQTLLMKRRNSLKLRKDVIDQKVKALRTRVGRSSADGTDSETAEEEQNLLLLENKLKNIEKELLLINRTADIPPENVFKEGKKKNKQQLFSKFKSNQKTSQANHKASHQRDNTDKVVSSESLSPAVRKRSLSHNFKLFSASKRHSDLSDMSINRASMSSLDSSTDGTFGVNDFVPSPAVGSADLKSSDEYKVDSVRTRKTSSVSSVSELDEPDGMGHNQSAKEASNTTENGLSKDAFLKIAEFEQFAVEITARRLTDYVDV